VSWLPTILIALVAFAVAVLLLRLPRSGWSLFGAALLFGLAGYAIQGHPGQEGAPKPHVEAANESGPALIDARRALFDPTRPPGYYITLSDGFARKGKFADAAGLLRGALDRNPRDTEAWIALGNALIEHAGGVPTPAALYAYARAERSDPDHPAAAYFLGIALLRAGQPGEARAIWAQLVDEAPEDADWLPAMRQRLETLDRMLAAASAQPAE